MLTEGVDVSHICRFLISYNPYLSIHLDANSLRPWVILACQLLFSHLERT